MSNTETTNTVPAGDPTTAKEKGCLAALGVSALMANLNVLAATLMHQITVPLVISLVFYYVVLTTVLISWPDFRKWKVVTLAVLFPVVAEVGLTAMWSVIAAASYAYVHHPVIAGIFAAAVLVSCMVVAYFFPEDANR